MSIKNLAPFDYQTGAIRAAAAKLKITTAEYLEQRANGLQYCGYLCRAWKPKSEFFQTQKGRCKECNTKYLQRLRLKAKGNK